MSVRVVIADDQDLVRTGLRMILDVQPDLLVSGDMSCLMHITGLARVQGRPIEHKHAIQVLRDTLQ